MLSNVDVSSIPDITHTKIDRIPKLQGRAIGAVLGVVGGEEHALSHSR
jgi:hypothetical protein